MKAEAVTMRAIRFDAPGGPDLLYVGTADTPVPGPGEVLIKAQAVGANRPDI